MSSSSSMGLLSSLGLGLGLWLRPLVSFRLRYLLPSGLIGLPLFSLGLPSSSFANLPFLGEGLPLSLGLPSSGVALRLRFLVSGLLDPPSRSMLRSFLAGDLDRLERGKNKRVEQNKQIYCQLERSYLVNAIALYYKICLFLFILKKSRTLKN